MQTFTYVVTINPDQLELEMMATLDTDYIGMATRAGEFDILVEDTVTQAQVDTIVSAHNPDSKTDEQLQDEQSTTTKTALSQLFQGLGSLSAKDKGYAVYGRLMAFSDGATNETIYSIVDRLSATTYLTSKPEWVAMDATTKAFIADMLETNAVMVQALIALFWDKR